MYRLREGWELLKELGTILGDTRQELSEIVTDGFKEMVIEGNSNFETSYEMQEKADEIVESARKLYKNRLHQLKSEVKQAEAALGEFNELVGHIVNTSLVEAAQLLGSANQIGNKKGNAKLYDFLSYESLEVMTKKDISSEDLSGFFLTTWSPPELDYHISVVLSFVQDSRKNILGQWVFGTDGKRRERASEYLTSAREFRTEVDLQVEKMKIWRTGLKYAKAKTGEVSKVLNQLEELLQRSLQLAKGDSLEAAEREGILLIGAQFVAAIDTILSTPILTEKGYPNKEIELLLAKL